jgi:biopolymer transport protein ExbD
MRLGTAKAAPFVFPALAAVNLAFVVWLVLFVSGLFASDRGLRVAVERGGPATRYEPRADDVFVTVLPDGALLVDGEPTDARAALDAIVSKARGAKPKAVVVFATDQTPYGALVTLLGELGAREAGGSGAPAPLVPTHNEVRAIVNALGRNPFLPVRSGSAEAPPP